MTLQERLREINADQAADELDRLSAENEALRQERDALAATIFILTPYCPTSATTGKPILPRDIFDILAARDARVRSEALLDSAEDAKPAPDVSALVEALERITKTVGVTSPTSKDFQEIARKALAEWRAKQ